MAWLSAIVFVLAAVAIILKRQSLAKGLGLIFGGQLPPSFGYVLGGFFFVLAGVFVWLHLEGWL